MSDRTAIRMPAETSKGVGRASEAVLGWVPASPSYEICGPGAPPPAWSFIATWASVWRASFGSRPGFPAPLPNRAPRRFPGADAGCCPRPPGASTGLSTEVDEASRIVDKSAARAHQAGRQAGWATWYSSNDMFERWLPSASMNHRDRRCGPSFMLPVPEMTKEQLLDRFQSLQVQDGTYEVIAPNRVLLRRRVSQFPQNHKTEQVMEWKVTGDQLSLTIMSDTGSAPVGQISTYRRLKK